MARKQNAAPPLPLPASLGADVQCVVRTVVVADLVGYSAVARMLEENAGSASVAELNRQIQALVQACLSQLPDLGPHTMLSDTGDGAILLFESAADAHQFAELVQRNAHQHNQSRTEKSAKRHFRIGMATGELAQAGPTEYAGATISNAVRLESAARPGEIIADVPTYDALPAGMRKAYMAESSVKGKRREVFRVRRYRVVAGFSSLSEDVPMPAISRRSMIGLAAGATAAAATGIWLKRVALDEWMHPLPLKRFIALHSWPKPAQDLAAVVTHVVSSIEDRVARAESKDRHLLIMVPSDPLLEGTGRDEGKTKELANSLGANLVLTASSRKTTNGVTLDLHLVDADSQKTLRHRRISTEMAHINTFDRAAAEAAAMLLGLPPGDSLLADQDDLSHVSPSAYQMYVEAKRLAELPNDAGIDAAIEKFQQLTNEDPRFSLGYSELAHAYVRKYELTSDRAILELAKQNTLRALTLNPDSARGLLALAKINVRTGQRESALAALEKALKLDPTNPSVLLFKAFLYRNESNLIAEEDLYRQIISNRPNYWVAYNELGGVLKRQARYAEAVEQYTLASHIAPKVSLPLTNLGMMYIETAENDKARETLQRSIALFPSENAYIGLGNIAFEKKDYRQALTLYQQALALSPRNHGTLRDIGDCYTRLAQPDKVRESFAAAADILASNLTINPKIGADWMVLSFYDAKVGNFTRAASDIATAERLGAGDLESQFTKAQTLAVMGKKEEALQLVLDCMDRKLSPVNVDLAVDLKDVQADPRYRGRVAMKQTPPPPTHTS